MIAAHRHKEIVKLLSQKSFCSLPQLADFLHVSLATARRDLNVLQDQGVLKRTHGGAVFLGSQNELPLFADRQSIMARQKKAIGRYAAALVENGDSIIIDGGTTTYEMARQLQNKDIQVVSNSLPVANLFANSRNVQLITTGGLLYPGTGVYLGPQAEETLCSLRVQKAFIGVAGITQEGFHNSNSILVRTQEYMMRAARQVYVLCDHTKFGRNALAYLCNFSRITAIITDSLPREQEPLGRSLRQKDVKIMLCDGPDVAADATKK